MKSKANNLIMRMAITLTLLLIFPFGSISYAKEITDIHTIKLVQAALNSEGYECGKVDGISGKNTKVAIEAFQTAKGLEVNGLISDELVTALDITPEMLKGVVIGDFVQRYNESVVYLNDISSQTGDPTIQQISTEELQSGISDLDDITVFQVASDERKIAITGVSLARTTNDYDIPMVYELVSSSYAMDDEFSNVEEAIAFVGTFVEEKSAVTEKMNYGIWNHDGVIYFTVVEVQ